MDIDFIKWLCGKADGFEWDEVNEKVIAPASTIFGMQSEIFQKEHYPLLLQRAIEGVNREDAGYRIEQCYNQIDICDTEEYNCLTVYGYENGIDAAKESALRYICEQEKK